LHRSAIWRRNSCHLCKRTMRDCLSACRRPCKLELRSTDGRAHLVQGSHLLQVSLGSLQPGSCLVNLDGHLLYCSAMPVQCQRWLKYHKDLLLPLFTLLQGLLNRFQEAFYGLRTARTLDPLAVLFRLLCTILLYIATINAVKTQIASRRLTVNSS
jgi:hypothetical protein